MPKNEIEKLKILYGKLPESKRAALRMFNTKFEFEHTDEKTGEYHNSTDLDLLFNDLEKKIIMSGAKKFVEGIIVFKKSEKAPDFVKAEIVINPRTLVDWIKANPEELTDNERFGKQLKLTLKEAKEGGLYLDLNNYKKPEVKEEPKAEPEAKKQPVKKATGAKATPTQAAPVNDDDLPF